MTDQDNFPSCEEILNLPADAVPQLVQDLSARRELSRMVRALNADVLQGDAATQDRARKVLSHLGFVVP